jgi:hypothetical protein
MATANFSTYTLSPAVAASLRVPPIQYENDVVPGHVLSRVTGQHEEDTPVSEIDELLAKRLMGGVN